MYVASRSILSICDHKINNPESESTRLPSTYPSKYGETIYIHPTALTNFINNYLPNIKFPFVLISGDSDTTVPTDVQTQSDIILNHPLLLCWYSQNCTKPDEKLKQLPIGIDFHTLIKRNLNKLKVFYFTKYRYHTLKSQEEEITNLVKLKNERKNLCYANFHFLLNTRYANDRSDAIKMIPKNLVYYEPIRVNRSQSWKTMVNYKYVISPHGNGLDCHRTWESIALGCIPILKSSPLDTMFEGLPVLIVKEWSDVTAELLNTYQPINTNTDKIMLSYWEGLLNKYKTN